MSLILSIPVAFVILTCGIKLNLSSDQLLLITAIIFAGGLAGCKD